MDEVQLSQGYRATTKSPEGPSLSITLILLSDSYLRIP